MLDRLIRSGPFAELTRQLHPADPQGRYPRVWAGGTWGSAAPMVCAALASPGAERDPLHFPAEQDRPAVVLLVVAHLDAADNAVEDAELFMPDREVDLLPGWAGMADYSDASDEIAAERLSLCRRLAEAFPPSPSRERAAAQRPGEGAEISMSLSSPSPPPPLLSGRGEVPPMLIVAPVQALQQPVPGPADLRRAALVLRAGQEISPDAVAGWLADHGFVRVELVDVPGDFAVRGGIVDIFPAGERALGGQPMRIDFFGDQIESIRTFDIDTQRSHPDAIDEIELFGGMKNPEFGMRNTDLRHGETDSSIPNSEFRIPHSSFLDYLPAGSIVAFSEPNEIQEFGKAYFDRSEDRAGLLPVHTLLASNPRLRQLFMSQFGPDASQASDAERAGPSSAPADSPPPRGREDDAIIHFGCQSLQRFETSPHEAVIELIHLAEQQDVVVYCDNPAEKQRLAELIEEARQTSNSSLSVEREGRGEGTQVEVPGHNDARAGGPAAKQDGATPAPIQLKLGFLHSGFAFPPGGFALVGHHEIFHRYRTRHRVRRVQAGRPIDSFLDLQPGDYVVHVTHGIAKFTGTKMLTKGQRTEEYLTLKFADDAVLHVPASQIHLVQKYVGAFRGHPKLSKLGGRAWDNKKQQVALAVMDLASELLATQARRQSQPGVAYPADNQMQREFEDSFVYQETEDQLLTLREIKKDLQSARPMDRLLCGDVGYGKTELAIRAAFKVVQAGKQAAVLVPTTVLAEQHERTFRERFADYPVTIESISRFRTGRQARDIVQRTRSGQVDVLIGTHRLLSEDVDFRDLGLVVIDEEQRFGVAHKEKLKQMRASIDILTMTATPIPRTLHMSLLGLRDISSLTTPPMDRRAIHTEVLRFNPQQIRQAIIRELNRDGQVYFVHNRVHNIQSIADRIKQIAPEARIIVGHGQMHGHELEKVMLKVLRREADVLVCTTIIESGVDIPNVNTIFIHDADRFGLAELHQLRGRVGRYKHKAYCYLLLPETRPVTPTAGRRLKAIEEYSELGAGFRIALRDLEIRGAGNILGPEQSGHISAVGYEMYCQLLDAAVRKLKGEPPQAKVETHLELGIGGHLPKSYMPSDRQRMEVYRRLAHCRNDADIEQLESDLADAYGPLPEQARNLLDQTQLRIWASHHAIRTILAQPPDLVFTVEDMKRFGQVSGRARGGNGPGILRVIDDRTVHLRLTPAYFEPATLMSVLRKLLRPRR